MAKLMFRTGGNHNLCEMLKIHGGFSICISMVVYADGRQATLSGRLS